MTVVVKNAAEFHKLLESSETEVLDFVHLSSTLDRVQLRYRQPFQKGADTNNLVAAIFITAYARLCLYDSICLSYSAL
jgi:hypothetical protein